MIENVITSILEAEKEAEKIVKDAQVESKKMNLEADGKAKEIKLKTAEEMKNLRKKKLSEAADGANLSYEAQIKDAKIEAETLKINASERLEKTAQYIVGRIID